MRFAGSHGKRLCYFVYFLLLLHHTGGKACFERDAVGGRTFLSALDTANTFAASEVWEFWNICEVLRA